MPGFEQALPSGLQGYLAATQGAQQNQLAQLQQAQGLLGLQGELQKQQKQRDYETALQGLGPNPTGDALAGVAAKYAGPEKALDVLQRSQDKKAALAQQAEAAQSRLDTQRQQAEMLHEFRMSRLQGDADKQAETERHNKAIEAINAQNAQLNQQLKMMGLDLQKMKVEQGNENQRQRQVQQLGTALERANLPQADSVLREVETALQKTPDLAEYMSGIKSLTPDMLVNNDIAKGRQAFQKLFNITLKDRSGAAVTVPEFERLKSEFGNGTWKTPEMLKNGVEQARNIISNHYRSIASGFGPDTVNAYNENLKTFGGSPLTLEPSKPAVAPKSQFPKGQTATGPNGQKIMFDGEKWVPAQ